MKRFLRNQTGIVDLFVVAVLFIILVGGAVYLYARRINNTPTYTSPGLGKPSTTAMSPYTGWPTYTSTAQKLSFKYPKGWYIREDPSSSSTIYISSVQGVVDKGNWPADFQMLWISSDPNETALANENNTKAGKPSCCEISGPVTASTIKSGSLVINAYQYQTVGGPELEAYWTNSAGKRFVATNSVEVGETNQQNMVANLKLVLATVKFTN